MKRIRIFDDDFPTHFAMTINYERGRNPEKKYAWIDYVNEMESVEE